MSTLTEIISVMEELAPLELAEAWDNPGLQLGDRRAEIKRILLCLDLDPQTLQEAIALDVQLIISHHPLLFKPLPCLDFAEQKGQIIKSLIKHDINAYAAHTNLDKAIGGVNEQLLQLLGLRNVGVLQPLVLAEAAVDVGLDGAGSESAALTGLAAAESVLVTVPGLGRLGKLPQPVLLRDFLGLIKEKLNLPVVKYGGDLQRQISLVAVCGGAGASLLSAAADSGADLFVTGDIKYHEAQDILAQGLAFADGGHFATENHSMPALAERLRKCFEERNWPVEVLCSQQQDIFSYC